MYWQHVIGVVCVLAACHRDGVCTGSMSLGMVCVLAACHRYGVCIGSMA